MKHYLQFALLGLLLFSTCFSTWWRSNLHWNNKILQSCLSLEIHVFVSHYAVSAELSENRRIPKVCHPCRGVRIDACISRRRPPACIFMIRVRLINKEIAKWKCKCKNISSCGTVSTTRAISLPVLTQNRATIWPESSCTSHSAGVKLLGIFSCIF